VTVLPRSPFPVPFGWFCVGYPEEFPTGEPKALFYFDRHLVAWRDESAELHVQDPFCPHLGAHLGHGGTVEGCEIVCPFHGWRFDAEGVNVDIPYS
jgi:3-ketosteroid 9alpha-monooxygenase subunit A